MPEMPRETIRRQRRGGASGLLGTVGGRALLLGIALKLLVTLGTVVALVTPSALNIVDTLGSICVAIGGAYFLVAMVMAARRRLLWRVRRKLIISYIFIGFIPALLIVAFFLVGGFILFSNFSAYLVQNRLRAMSERALGVAETTALEVRLADGRDLAAIANRRQLTLARETPAASIALVPMSAACGDIEARRGRSAGSLSALTAGPWVHLDAPADVPTWIGCDGFAGVLAYDVAERSRMSDTRVEQDVRLVVRAVALPQDVANGHAVIVDLPVDGAVRARLRDETSVELTSVVVVDRRIAPQHGRSTPSDERLEPSTGAMPQPAVSFLEHYAWETGETGTLQMSMQLSIGRLYARLVEAQGSAAGGSLGLGQAYVLIFLAFGLLVLLIQAIAIMMGLALARSITGSVHELFAGTVRVRQGDFTHRIAVTAPDQLGALAESFNSMTGSIEQLLIEASEKRRLEEELRIAHEIQMSLLPQAPAAIPGLSVTALCVPAREVGGDYYDFLPLDEDRLGFLIADVAGKGTSAALYMAELKGLMLSLSRTYSSPRELLVMANRLIAAHLDSRSFITMTYAVIDLRRRTLTYARAGHTPLFYLPGGETSEERTLQVLAPDGLVLGLKIDDGTLFERLLQEQTIPLRNGDVYLLYTDGLTEAMNPQDDCFGEQRLGRIIEEHADLPCAELRERLLRDIAAFVGEAPQHDDMTLILLKVDALPPVVGPLDDAQGGHAVAEVVRS